VAQEAFTGRIAPLSDAADRLERRLLTLAIGARTYLLDPDAEAMRRSEGEIEAADAALQRLGEIPKEPDGVAAFEQLRPQVEAYLVDISRMLRRGQAGDGTQAGLAVVRERTLGELQAFSRLQRAKTRATLEAMKEARTRASEGTALAVALALILFGVLAAFTVRSIRNPARELVEVAEALEQGNWQPALAWAPQRGRADARPVRDEMLKLAHAFGAAAAALERREQRLRADRHVASATGSSLSKEVISESALRAICEHLQAEVGALYWSESASDVLTPIASHAMNGAAAPVALGEGIPGQAAKQRRAVVARDIPRDSPFSVKLGYDQAPPRCVAAVPVAFRDELLGVLLVASLRDLDAEALSFLEAAGAQLAIGLQNVKAYEQIQKLLAELGEKNEQVQAQNEELQAQNEEIQTQNEELQAQGEEIQAQNEELKVQTEQLREHAGTLAEADRRKTEFLGILAHELRNPMAAISNSLYALVNSGRNPEMRGRAEQVIDRQTRMLARLVDDLLDATRIASGKVRLQKETVELVDVVRECAEDYRGAAEKAGLLLELHLPEGQAFVEGDRTRLCQILGNLLDNAIKFGGEKQVVAVKLQRLPERSQVELRVVDQGIGIDGPVLARLFQPFSQADTSLARPKSGLGLGLALVKALVDMQGGSVQANSAGLGRGAEFIVRLPLSRSKGQRTEKAGRPSSGPATPRRILIIEDNADAAHTLKDAMELHGHEVRVAYDAHEGFDAAREFQPDVLLCDIGLPSMDGYQLASRFRADERLKSVFLVAVTGYAGPDDQERAAQAGFDRHFGKPPDIQRLQQILQELSADS
jgi:signal transduction histidine kinase